MTSPPFTWKNLGVSICALAALVLMVFGCYMLLRIDEKIAGQSDLASIHTEIGEYRAERDEFKSRLAQMQDALDVEVAWKTSLKGNLAELLAYTQSEQARVVIRRMIEEESNP